MEERILHLLIQEGRWKGQGQMQINVCVWDRKLKHLNNGSCFLCEAGQGHVLRVGGDEVV